MIKRVCSIGFSLIAAGLVGTVQAQENLSAKTNSFQPQPASVSSSVADNDRLRDGLLGPVRRIKTEIAKLTNSGGKLVEDKRIVLESSAYDLKGHKTENTYSPIAGATLTGREVYKYDDKGNISEMTLHSADGSLVSKEVYKYEYDSVGNWVKMTTSVAVVENSKIGFEPTEVTYRTIFYYLDANMAKMLQPPASVPAAENLATTNQTRQPIGTLSSGNEVKSAATLNPPPNTETSTVTALPPQASLDKLKLSANQPVAGDFRGMPVSITKKTEIAESDAPPPRPLLKPVS